MSVLRQMNWLGQARVDVPHLRSIDASVAGDFDLLAGRIIANKQAVVVKGFNILSSGVFGGPATSLQLSMAGGIVIHHEATEGGSVFAADEDADNEQLVSTNENVSGSWTAGAANYVSIDLVRAADDTTADVVQFIDPDSREETPLTTALARTLKVKIYVKSTPFSASSTLLPIAKVTLDSGGNVTALQDARNMMFRLASGGDSPDITSKFPWTAGRSEVVATDGTDGDPFSGGDRAISSLKEWADSVMTRLWELGGGTYWYSAGNQFNVRLTRTTPVFSNGDNFEWDGTNLHWKTLTFVFDNAGTTPYYNTISDQTSDSVSVTDLADGECVYVDLDRTSNATITAAKATLGTLGMSTIPGQRFVIAWRFGSSVFSRDYPYAVGTVFTPATSSSTGVVRLNTAVEGGRSSTPDCAVTDANGNTGKVIAAGLSRGNGSAPYVGAGTLLVGTLASDTTVQIGGASTSDLNIGTTLPVSSILTVGGTENTLVLKSIALSHTSYTAGASAGYDNYFTSNATRTNGYLFGVLNNNDARLRLTYDGHLQLLGRLDSLGSSLLIGTTNQTALTIGRAASITTLTGSEVSITATPKLTNSLDYSYDSVKTKHIDIPASSFMADSTNLASLTITAEPYWKVVTGAGSPTAFMAKVAVPANATITAIQFLGYRSGANATVTLTAFRNRYNSGGGGTISYIANAVATTNTAASATWFTVTLDSTTVQILDDDMLMLLWSLAVPGSGTMYFYTVRVTYTILTVGQNT